MAPANAGRGRSKQNVLQPNHVFLTVDTEPTYACVAGSEAQEKPLLVWAGHVRYPSEHPPYLTKENEIEKRTWRTGNLSDLGTFPDFKIH